MGELAGMEKNNVYLNYQ